MLVSSPAAPMAAETPPTAVPTTRTRSRAVEAIATTGLLLLGGGLRLGQINLVPYRYDDDALYAIVMRMARTGQIPFSGLTSTIGLPNGPFQAYLLAPFGWVGASPAIMTAGVGLLNVLALALLYGFVRDFFGRRVALLALLLAAVNPWAVILSRRLLGNDMVAPFAVLSLWMLARWSLRRDDRAILIAGPALAIAGQVYVIGLECLAPAVAAAALAGRRLLRWHVAVALALFLALMAPYLWTQAVPHVSTLLYIRGQASAPATFDLSAVKYALELASGEGYQTFATQAGGRLDATSGLPGWLGLLARGFYAFGVAIGAWTMLLGRGPLTRERRAIHLLLLVAALMPVVALLRHAVPLQPLYMVATFPLPYLYSAIAIERLWQWAARLIKPVQVAGRGALGAAVGSIVVIQCLLGAVFFSVMGEYWAHGNYGLPWQLIEQLVTETRQLQQQTGAARVLVLDDANDFNQVEWVLAEQGFPVADFDDTRQLVLPGVPTLYLAPGDQAAQRTLLTSYADDMIRQERLPGDGTMVRFYFLTPAGSSPPPPALSLGWTVRHGAAALLRLDGVDLPRRLAAGQTVPIAVSMTVLAQPDPALPNFSIFAHLLDRQGHAVAGRDDGLWQTRYWRPGDHIRQTLDVAIPTDAQPGVVALALGVYAVSGATVDPLALSGSDGASLGSQGSAPVATIAPPPAAPPVHSLSVRLANGVALDGYDLTQSGSALTVTLNWSASQPVPRNLTAFVHVLDPGGHLLAQHDGQPADGAFPTSFWQAGDRIADVHHLSLPATLPSGQYRLEFGLYDLRTLQRLAVLSGQPTVAITLPLSRSA